MTLSSPDPLSSLSADWTIRPATLDDREATLELLEATFGPSPTRAAVWDWVFAANPCTSELYYMVTETGSRIVAQNAFLPVSMQHHGRPVRGLVPVMAATDPGWQNRGALRAMAQTLFDQTSDSCPIVYAFPNPMSASVAYGHLSFVDLRPFPQLRRPLRNTGRHDSGSPATAMGAGILDLTARLARDRRVDITEIEDFSGIANPIWEAIAPLAGTAVIRDERFLNWRFVQAPYRYQRLLARRRGRPVGIAVLTTGDGDGKARLMELMVLPGEPVGVARTLLREVTERATRDGAVGLACIATRRHPQYRALLSAGLVPEPRLSPRPSPLDAAVSSFGVRINGPGVTPARLLHIDDWYLSGADQDWQ
jgi:hypothetical protein